MIKNLKKILKYKAKDILSFEMFIAQYEYYVEVRIDDNDCYCFKNIELTEDEDNNKHIHLYSDIQGEWDINLETGDISRVVFGMFSNLTTTDIRNIKRKRKKR